MPVPPRGHDAAKVYIESDDDGAPLPSDVVCLHMFVFLAR